MRVLFALLVWLIKIGLLVAIAIWSFNNIWLLLGTFAVVMIVLIAYGMITSDNDWISSIARLFVAAMAFFALYVTFN